MSATCAMPIPFPISRTSCISIQVTQTPAQQFLESTLTRWGTRLLRSHRLECPLPALCRFRFLYQEQAVYLYKLPKHRRNSFWNPRLPAGVHACSEYHPNLPERLRRPGCLSSEGDRQRACLFCDTNHDRSVRARPANLAVENAPSDFHHCERPRSEEQSGILQPREWRQPHHPPACPAQACRNH